MTIVDFNKEQGTAVVNDVLLERQSASLSADGPSASHGSAQFVHCDVTKAGVMLFYASSALTFFSFHDHMMMR